MTCGRLLWRHNAELTKKRWYRWHILYSIAEFLEMSTPPNEKAIARLLVRRGEALMEGRTHESTFLAGEPDANRLVTDLKSRPHAFVMACVADRQIKAELAWRIPYRLSQRIGDFKIATLAKLSEKQFVRLMTKPEPLHRYPDVMGRLLYAAVKQIRRKYGGNAAQIWAGRPSSAAVVYRFLEFRGVGPKIANMAVNILVRHFDIPLADYYSIDISADVHVRRVLRRLGLVPQGATMEQVVYRARSLNPEFPGLIDLPCWEIGRWWCRPRKTRCHECHARKVCPSAKAN